MSGSASLSPPPPSNLAEKPKMGSDALIWGDKLVLRGLLFHGFHGAMPEERTLGQKFLVDVDAWMDLKVAGKSDDLSDTISYTDIYRIAKEVLEGSPYNLLESVAQKIASTTLNKSSKNICCSCEGWKASCGSSGSR